MPGMKTKPPQKPNKPQPKKPMPKQRPKLIYTTMPVNRLEQLTE